MNKIWLIRHGECHSNTGVKNTSPATSTLTEKGVRQSECVASSIDIQPDRIIHSPFIRSLQSAQPTINRFPAATVEQWPVQEFIYLPYEKYRGTTRADRKAAVDAYWQQCDPQQKNSAEAESFVEFIDRMETISEKLKRCKGSVIIFTHGHVIRAMMWKIMIGRLAKDKNAMLRYRSLRHALYIPNAVILKINLDEPVFQMSQLITSHLKPELRT